MADKATVAHAAASPGAVNSLERTYFGVLNTVREVRRDVREALAGCPETVTDDAALVASELAANAIKHSRSGSAQGTYIVRIYHYATGPYVWVEVEDQGNPAWDGVLRIQPTRGLGLIRQLSTWLGSENAANGARAVCARLDYNPDGTPLYSPTAPELPDDLRALAHPDKPAIRDIGNDHISAPRAGHS